MIHSLNHVFQATSLAALAFDVEWPARAWHYLRSALQERHRRAVAWRELRSLDEHTMRDIGLSHRAAAEWPRIRDEW